MTFAVGKCFGLVGVDQEILEWNTKVGTQGGCVENHLYYCPWYFFL